MPRIRVLAVFAVACFCIAAAFALSSRPDHQVTAPPAPTTTTVMPPASQYDPTNGLDVALRTFEDHQAAAAAEREAINQAILDALAPPPRYELPPAYVAAAPRNEWGASMEPCGGDLPPCYVKARESGGSYSARNNESAGAACGAWQIIGSTWAGFGGYPDACSAPPAVQDAKARELWAGGAGCSHWSAC